MKIQQALAQSRPAEAASLPSHSLEAQVLLAEITGKDRPWVLAHPEAELTDEQSSLFMEQLGRIQSGVPLAYILERQAFYGRDFRVSRATLIPRPETEQMISLALELAAQFPADFLVADVGTGSGCIGITLACELPGITVLAVDRSLEALRIASRNARVHQVDERCRMVQASLLEPFSIQCMLICANLPYIPSSRLKTLEVARHEPSLALDGGPDGMQYTRPLVQHMQEHLHPAGSAILEIDEIQANSLLKLASRCLPSRHLYIAEDSAGIDRFLVISPEGG